MNKTQNVLSFNHTKLDYQAMLQTSRTAYSHCLEEIGRYSRGLREIKPSILPYLTAQWLLREAEQLVIAAETMHTLQEGLKREELEVVNKPEVEGGEPVEEG